jgi:hypothetical protein
VVVGRILGRVGVGVEGGVCVPQVGLVVVVRPLVGRLQYVGWQRRGRCPSCVVLQWWSLVCRGGGKRCLDGLV